MPKQILSLTDKTIHTTTTKTTTTTHTLSTSIDSIPQKSSTITLSSSTPIYNIVHPENARYRSDLPAHYYITSITSSGLGNIRLESTRSRFKKVEFRALLSPGRTAGDSIPFLNHSFNQSSLNGDGDSVDESSEKVLFTAKASWSGKYKWFSGEDVIGVEEEKGDERRLLVEKELGGEVLDALVAVWVLRLWFDVAESEEARREYLERWVKPANHPASTVLGTHSTALGALGVLGGAGG